MPVPTGLSDLVLPGDIASTGGLGVPAITLQGGGQIISSVGPYAAEPYEGSNIAGLLGAVGEPYQGYQPYQPLGAGAGVVGPVQQPVQGTSPIAGAIGAIPAIAGAAGLTLPAWVLAALGLAGAAYGTYQALGGGEGGGLFGLNVLGGDEFTMGGLEFGGPGLPEPLAPYREWRMGNKQFYYVPQYTQQGKFKGAKVAMYNRDTKQWKVWGLPKPNLAIVGKNMPSHRMLTRLRRNLKRHSADAKTILQVASPAYYAKTHGYYKRRRR